ncbi:hypothetical protein BDV93DRAFT_543742 [Ceratobasidium sp. AG-I]|nr:hypothetical protein BDV93DRAFT_543742 [Ceratobasidium sp. AG-I]
MDDSQTNNKMDIIDLGAGDIELCVNNTIFKTHKYKLSKFSILHDLFQNADHSDRPRHIPTISVQRDTGGVEDFRNTFKVLYASVVTGPFTFEPSVLISALRISSAYEYPALRAFSITHLEGIHLLAIHRIELAREFQLTSWEGPAYDELYTREQAITQQEARVLGSDAFTVVAGIREENLKKEKATLRDGIVQVRQEAEERVKEMADLVASHWESREAAEHAGRVAWEREIRESWAKIQKVLRCQKLPGLREGIPMAIVVLVMSFVWFALS